MAYALFAVIASWFAALAPNAETFRENSLRG
jgi:hypothetical protein